MNVSCARSSARAQLFEPEPPPAAEPFVTAVLQRVRRRQRIRWAVLAAAAALGLVLSLDSLIALAERGARLLTPTARAWEELAALPSGWEQLGRLGAELWPALVLTLAALSWPALLRWLAK